MSAIVRLIRHGDSPVSKYLPAFSIPHTQMDPVPAVQGCFHRFGENRVRRAFDGVEACEERKRRYETQTGGVRPGRLNLTQCWRKIARCSAAVTITYLEL
jgi:hypothetical protein